MSIYNATLCSSAEVRTNSMRVLTMPLEGFQLLKSCFFLVSSMLKWDLTVTLGPSSWDILVSEIWKKMGKGCSNSAHIITSAFKHILFLQSTPHSLLETPQVWSLAPAGLCHLKRSPLNYTFTTQSYHIADCDTAHYLTASKMWLKSKCIHCSMQKCWSCMNASKTAGPDFYKQFDECSEQPLQACTAGGVDDGWNHVCDVIYNTAMDTFCKNEKQN